MIADMEVHRRAGVGVIDHGQAWRHEAARRRNVDEFLHHDVVADGDGDLGLARRERRL